MDQLKYKTEDRNEELRPERARYNKRRAAKGRGGMLGLGLLLLAVAAALTVVLAVRVRSRTETASADRVSPESPYKSFYYYEEERSDRYAAYAALNPGMDAGDVVWRVDADLDKHWYEYDISVDTYDDPYIIVNKYRKVPEDYRPPDLTEADGCLMRADTAAAYTEMKTAAAKNGMRIKAVSGYRSVEYQAGLYNRYLSEDSREKVDRYSARPGYSEHHTGMAIDLFGSVDGLRNFENSPEGLWVREHCWEYGFIIRYTEDIEEVTGYENEPWHIRYVGRAVSEDMKNKGTASFEEYWVKYIKHSPGR